MARTLVTSSIFSPVTATGTTVGRTLEDRFADIVNVKDFGAVGDGVTDDTAAIQAAINAAINGNTKNIFLPSTNGTGYRLTSTINITGYMQLYGTGASIIGASEKGSWLYFDHSSVGLSATVGYQGVVLKDFGTYRNQPWITTNWTPSAHDFDILFRNCIDTTIDNLLLLNPTKAIHYTGELIGGGGRHNINNLRSQPFNIGVQVDVAFDVCRFNNIHLWPFYLDNTNIHNYTRNNLIGLNLLRCDNPNIVNYFTFAPAYGIKFDNNPNIVGGITSRALITNYGIDAAGKSSILVTGNGTTAQLTNGYVFGTFTEHPAASATNGVLVSANNVQLQITNLRSTYTHDEAIKVVGNNNNISCSQLALEYWNNSNTTKNAVSVSGNGTSRVYIADKILSTGGNSANIINDAVAIRSVEWLTYNPIVSASTGSLGSYSAQGKYNVRDNLVTLMVDLSIGSAGTGTNFLTVTLPVTSVFPNFRSILTGREIAINGKSAIGTVLPSGINHFTLTNYDNTSPIVNNAQIVVSGNYTI